MTEQKPNLTIIAELRAAGKPQRWLAGKARLHESIISLIINGRLLPNRRQRQAIARALRLPAEQIFT